MICTTTGEVLSVYLMEPIGKVVEFLSWKDDFRLARIEGRRARSSDLPAA